MSSVQLTAVEVADYLERTRYGGDQWVVFREVRNATGFAKKTERYADMLAVSVWPSRGIYLEGLEIKVSRSDWLKELRNPQKADAFFDYCRHWFVAAPKGVVEKSEVPAAWGFIELTAKRHRTVKQPRENPNPKPLDLLLFASLVRHLKKTCGYSEKDIYDRVREKAQEAEKAIVEACRARHDVRRLRQLEQDVKKFESATGLRVADHWEYENIRRLIPVVRHLRKKGILRQLEQTATFYESIAEQLREAAEQFGQENQKERTKK